MRGHVCVHCNQPFLHRALSAPAGDLAGRLVVLCCVGAECWFWRGKHTPWKKERESVQGSVGRPGSSLPWGKTVLSATAHIQASMKQIFINGESD